MLAATFPELFAEMLRDRLFGNGYCVTRTGAVMARPATRKKGPYTRAEIQRRYRQRKKREQPNPKIVAKQQRRAERERQLAEATIAASTALGSTLYGVICADPPWRHEPYSRVTGMDRAADNHYPTLTIAELMALKLPAVKDCVLFLWFPRSQVANAVKLAEAWGFTVKTIGGWDKQSLGTGYWLIDNLETYVIATRGRAVAPAPGQQWPALISAPRGRHSEKPEVFMEHIERLYPSVPKLEMYRPPPPGGLGQLGQ
jgi:N6-adenosine-specific RNA methylase IME4